MKNIIKIQFAVIAILVILLWFKGCENKTQTKSIIIPEIKGKFEAVKPNSNSPEFGGIRIGQNLSKNYKSDIDLLKKEYNFSQEEIDNLINENKQLEVLFGNTTDSLELEIYKLTKLKEFKQTFEDDNLKAEVSGVARSVEKIKFDYTIKEKKIIAPIKEKCFQLNAGGGIGIDKEATNVIYKLGVDLINSKGNQLELEYQKINGVDYGMVGYKFKVFSF